AMPANSCITVSSKPAMIALAVNKKSRTNSIIRASGTFSLNWLNYKVPKLRDYVFTLANPSDFSDKGDYDKLSSNGIPYLVENGQPFLIEAEANALCRNVRRVECGDHYLFLAKVIWGRASEDFLPISYWQFRRYKPILYLGSPMASPLTTIRD
ncbi:MAG: flavin reductase family protein, partial [Nitrososphaerales archaeon]